MTLPIQDRVELRDLISDYAFAIDLRQCDALRDVFTVDARIEYDGSTPHHGIDAIVNFFRTSASSCQATQHLIHTYRFRGINADQADGLIHVTAHHVANEVALPVLENDTFTVTGTYTDHYERTEAGWRIASRKLVLITRAGNPAVMTVY
ncbi:nuclear transport factor 2 family protein [Mycobacterium sp. pUA109]|uniref:nuclear transport factor 2 family protein n=1 Tax=Mycobacterium sp. pUA109 TaxID=3238982 RepID=UPI00351B8F5E